MNVMYPQLLWLLPLALALGPALAYLAWRRHWQLIKRWGDMQLIQRHTKPMTKRTVAFKGAVLAVGFALAVGALSRPYSPNATHEVPAGTVDCVVLLDVSRSMAASDCQGNTRIKTATAAIKDEILPALSGNQVGIITYAGRATPRVFLTYEHKSIGWLAENAFTVSSASGDGSAMGKAFDLAFQYFDVDSKKNHKKLIVLFSDGGVDDETKLEPIVAGLKERSVELVVLGVGQTIPAQILVSELSKEDQKVASGRFYQENGHTIRTALNEQLLNQLSEECGGSYQRVVEPRDASLARQKADLEMHEKVSRKELFFYPVLGFLACVIVVAMQGTLRRKDDS